MNDFFISNPIEKLEEELNFDNQVNYYDYIFNRFIESDKKNNIIKDSQRY